MKETTCKQLAGACDQEITGSTPEEMAENSKKHAMEMVQAGEQKHIEAMQKMMQMKPEDQKAWYQNFVDTFGDLENS